MQFPDIVAPFLERDPSQIKVRCMDCINGNYPLVECDKLVGTRCRGCPCKGCDEYCMVDYKLFKPKSERPLYKPCGSLT